MSLKNVELQVALPRTPDIGKWQEQLNQKPVLDQWGGVVQTKKQMDVERKKVTKSGNVEKGSVREKESDKRESGSHPYKGRFVDISL